MPNPTTPTDAGEALDQTLATVIMQARQEVGTERVLASLLGSVASLALITGYDDQAPDLVRQAIDAMKQAGR